MLASVLPAASSIECLTKKLGCTVLEIAVTHGFDSKRTITALCAAAAAPSRRK